MAQNKKKLQLEAKHSYFIQLSDRYVLESIANCSHEIGINPRNRRAFRDLLNLVQARSNLLAPEEGVSEYHRGEDYVRGIANLALHHENYLRSPREWKGGDGNKNSLFTSLARHLLTRYSPPGWLNSVWLRRLDARVLMDQELYRRAGAGERLLDLNPPMPLTRRMEHFLLTAPDDFRFHEALRYAEARALHCEERVARAFAGSPLNNNFENTEFWRGLIRLFAANPNVLEASRVGPLVDFINHVKFGRGRHNGEPGHGARPDFTLKGRTAASLLRLVEEWHAELNAHRAARIHAADTARRRQIERLEAQTWKKSGIRELHWHEGEGTSGEWLITEILQGGRLAWEGRVMRHCVATYQSVCRSGETTIWSMRRVEGEIEKPALTIQVHPRTRRIQQARGKHNRLPTKQEWPVLREWARREGLTMGQYI